MSEYEPLLSGSFHTLPSSPRTASQMMLMRSGSRYGRGRNRTPLTTLKTASVAPRPSPSVMTAAAAKRGLRRNMRTPYRRSWMKFSSGIGNLPSGAPWPFGDSGWGRDAWLDTKAWPRVALGVPRHHGRGADGAAESSPSSRTNTNDRLPRAPLGRVEGGDGIVEGRDGPDVRPQSSVPHPLDDLTQLGTIGLDNEVDRKAINGPRLRRPDDGHERSSGSNQARGPLPDVAADDIEHQIDAADVFQRAAVEVDKLLRAEVERLLTVGGASSADHVGAGQSCELRYHRPDCAGRAVRDHALPRPKAAVLEQSLPRGEARNWQASAHCEVNVARQRREVACLDRHILGQAAVRMPVREDGHALSYRESRRTVAEGGDHSGQLVAGDRRCSITVAAIGPGRGPRHLSRDESRRMNLNDDVVYRRLRLGPLHQLHPGGSRSLFRHHDRLHRKCLLSHLSRWWKSTL